MFLGEGLQFRVLFFVCPHVFFFQILKNLCFSRFVFQGLCSGFVFGFFGERGCFGGFVFLMILFQGVVLTCFENFWERRRCSVLFFF